MNQRGGIFKRKSKAESKEEKAGERENKSKSSSVMRVEWRSVSMRLKGPVW